MHTLHYQNKSIDLSEGWNELCGRQLIQLMDTIRLRRTQLQASIDALRILCKHSKLSFFMFKPECIDAFLPYVKWVFDSNTLTKQLIPDYDELHGPADELSNLRMKEFHFSEMHYKAYMEEQKEDDLNALIATLYRPARVGHTLRDVVNGDIREPFSASAADHYVKQVRQWPLNLRLAILFYYDGCRQHIIELYDVVFSEENESTTDDGGADYGMYGLMMELAGDKLGTVHQVEDMYVHSALASLEIMITKARKLEEQMAK